MKTKLTDKRDSKSLLLFLLFLIFMVFTIRDITNNDTIFHINIGSKIYREGIMTYNNFDTFSMHKNLNYIPYAYGFDLLLYNIYYNFHFFGVIIFRSILVGIQLLLSYKLLSNLIVDKDENVNNVLAMITAGVSILLMDRYLFVRPQMSSYIFLVLQIGLMLKWSSSFDTEKDKFYKIPYLIPISFLILANTHSGTVIFHLFIVGLFFFDVLINIIKEKSLLKNKKLHSFLFIMSLSSIASLINPYSPKHILFSFLSVGDKVMMQILEWHSPEMNSYVGIIVFTLLILNIVLYMRNKKCSLSMTLITITTFIMAAKGKRYLPYFIISSMYFIFFNIQNEVLFLTIKPKLEKIMKSKMIIVILAITILFVGNIKLDSYDNTTFSVDSRNPKRIAEYIISEKIKEPIYNDFLTGAYLVFKGVDNVFIDERSDLYTHSFNDVDVLQDAIQVLKLTKSPLDVMEKYNIEYGILNKQNMYYDIHVKDKEYKFDVVTEIDGFVLIKLKDIIHQ